MVEYFISTLPKYYISRIVKLDNLIDNDVAILHMCNQWMQASTKTDEIRNEVHLLQMEYVTNAMGPLLNHLTDGEWDEWSDGLLIHLEDLRTFNGQFLGLLNSRNQLNDRDADFYNLLMWQFALYYIIADSAYQRIRSRVIDQPGSLIFIECNHCLSNMHINFTDFCSRLSVKEEQINFVKKGFGICQRAPKGSWSEYYDKLTNIN